MSNTLMQGFINYVLVKSIIKYLNHGDILHGRDSQTGNQVMN